MKTAISIWPADWHLVVSEAGKALPTRILGRTIDAVQSWHRCRRDTQRLLEFTDAQLKDIGLSRGAITSAVTGRLHAR